jgi:hypothetical protein
VHSDSHPQIGHFEWTFAKYKDAMDVMLYIGWEASDNVIYTLNWKSTTKINNLEFGAKLNNLGVLSLWRNQLSRSVANSIENCSKLKLLYQNFNYLSGSVLGKLSLFEQL